MENQDKTSAAVDPDGLADVVELVDDARDKGVREYVEGYLVSLGRRSTDIGAQRARQIYGQHVADRWVDDGLRWVVCASNEGGMNGTEVDLFDLLGWLARRRPDLLASCGLRAEPDPARGTSS